MSEIREEIRCYANPDKVCPLRSAIYEVDKLHQTPIEERTTLDDYNERVKEIGNSISWLDRNRFYSILGTAMGRTVLEESCDFGPTKNFVLFGKGVCNAESRYEEWPAGPIEQQAV